MQRIGLVGPNGAGKTTLCRILARVDDPDTGQVSLPRSVTVGYLPQEAAGSASGSVLAEALGGFEAVWALEREMEDVARALETTPDDALTERYGELQHRFDALGGYRLESQARVILSGLGFRVDELTRPLAEFSGGWRMRVVAGPPAARGARRSCCSTSRPNHLDLELAGLAREFPRRVRRRGGRRLARPLLPQSHGDVDRRTSTPDGLTVFPGDYDDFLVEREAPARAARGARRNQAKRDRRGRALHRAIPVSGDQGAAGPELASRRWRRSSGSKCRAPGARSDSCFPSRRDGPPGRRRSTDVAQGLR